MLLRRLLVLALLSFVVSITTASGQKNDADLNSLSDADLKTLAITLERTGCYGNCPAYTVTIYGDGKVTYVGTNYVKTKGQREGRIDAAALRALLGEFARTKFLSLAADYSGKNCSCRQCTDMPAATTELKTNNISRRVDHYYGCTCAPKALFELESAIDKAVNSEQWTGDVSRQGPYGTTCAG